MYIYACICNHTIHQNNTLYDYYLLYYSTFSTETLAPAISWDFLFPPVSFCCCFTWEVNDACIIHRDSFSSSSRTVISDVRIVKDFTFQGLLGTQRLYTVQSKSSWLINVKKLESNMKLKTWSQLKRTETKQHNLLHKQCPPYLAVKNSQRDNTDTLRCMECCHSAVVCRGPGTSLSIISFVFAFLSVSCFPICPSLWAWPPSSTLLAPAQPSHLPIFNSSAYRLWFSIH